MTDPTKRRTPGDVFYFLFQTLPSIVVIVMLMVLGLVYGLVRLML